MEPYSIAVQSSPEKILNVKEVSELNLEDLRKHKTVKDVFVVLPRLEKAEEAEKILNKWGYKAFIGNSYNVAHRIVNAYKLFAPAQDFSVRVLATWKHVDMDYVDMLVARIRNTNCDLAAAPIDFDITMAADVGSLTALEKIGNIHGCDQVSSRARFNPWGYMDTHPQKFRVEYVEPAPIYSQERKKTILSQKRVYPENEFFGRDYQGSRYHFLVKYVPPNLNVLDIACGSGFGSYLLSQKSKFVLGVDYLEEYVNRARTLYKESEKLQFTVGDAQKFLYQGKTEQFDVVVSLHTLEHVPNDKAMLKALYNNLKTHGLLILEVPLLRKRPLGAPINPYHLREYTIEEITNLTEEAGFYIKKIIGGSRSFYVEPQTARDALQIHAIKP